ncbi:MAG: (d)CMP kinase [Anaerosomatales bacterium]|nr:(d)CMP kinase [Anaerosomatales bacterium]
MIVAIDGPAASGKSTVARALARRLGFRYLDTGAMYRAVAEEALVSGIALDDAAALAALARDACIAFEYAGDDPVYTRVTVRGRDVTAAIRTPQVDEAVSSVASIPEVRAAMVSEQRRCAGAGDIVVEGRDIGTVVFPDAEVKVYLTATPEERAARRLQDRRGAGHDAEFERVVADIRRRDEADSTRKAGPLATARDAVVVDTTGLSVDEVVERIERLVRERMP